MVVVLLQPHQEQKHSHPELSAIKSWSGTMDIVEVGIFFAATARAPPLGPNQTPHHPVLLAVFEKIMLR